MSDFSLSASQGKRIIELLEDILTATKANASARPASSTASSTSATPSGRAFIGWKAFPVPRFIKAYAGCKMGDMTKRDLDWWAGNYEPKEFKGQIQQADIDFRKALDEAAKDPTAGEGATPPPRPAKYTTGSTGGKPAHSPNDNNNNNLDEDAPFACDKGI